MRSFRKTNRPEKGEYEAYYQHYFDLVTSKGDILRELNDNFHKLEALLSSLPEEKLLYRYAEGKWSIKEMLVHLMDVERIFTYRALRAARKDQTPLPGFEEDDYAPASEADARSMTSILEEYHSLRLSTLQLFEHLPEEALLRRSKGFDSEGNPVDKSSVRAVCYFIAGHELHHLKVIKERYLL